LKKKSLWGVALLAVLIGCAQPELPAQAGLELESLLPEGSSLEGWRIAEGPTSYTPDTVWEYLDGGAPRYLAYGLVRMVHVRYQLGDDPLSSITAEVYEMGSELGSFGIYSSIRPPTLTMRPWGAEGYRFRNVAAAWKGVIFVHASADDERPELVERMEVLVSRVCDEAAGGVLPPPILDPLPPGGLVAHSERYVATDLLGHAAFGAGVLATYEIGGGRGELFFSELGDEAVAQEALETFRREKERWGEVSDTHAGFRFQDPGAGSGTILRSGRFVTGVHGDLPFEAQEDLLERLAERLDN
jgi:hypothetical protein